MPDADLSALCIILHHTTPPALRPVVRGFQSVCPLQFGLVFPRGGTLGRVFRGAVLCRHGDSSGCAVGHLGGAVPVVRDRLSVCRAHVWLL